jgi:hypothetical protein
MRDHSRVFRKAARKKSMVHVSENISIRIYISCHVFIIYVANVELRVTLGWIDGHDWKKGLKFLPTVNVCIISNHHLLFPSG